MEWPARPPDFSLMDFYLRQFKKKTKYFHDKLTRNIFQNFNILDLKKAIKAITKKARNLLSTN